MSGGDQYPVKIDLVNRNTGHILKIKIDVFQNSLSRKWLNALNDVLDRGLHLEKNYCFMGFVDYHRNGPYILDQINLSIAAINSADIGYKIDDYLNMETCITDDPKQGRAIGRNIVHEKFNRLHRYFEDLQGVSGRLSPFYQRADPYIKWHIRQLNLLCHEFESWALSYRKQKEAPEWQRPSQLMCWLNAPRFMLDEEDYELFGIDTINRSLGGVFVGVNKAIGKHHWEVFNDEGRDSRIGELITSTMRSQTEASADFDIEWGLDPGKFEWQKKRLGDFRHWLINNGFDPDDPALTIGHPKVAQVDLMSSFGTQDPQQIWQQLNDHLDVYAVYTADAGCTYRYHYSDKDYAERQIKEIAK